MCFGAVVLTPELDQTFYGQLMPISDKWNPPALAVSGLSREQTMEFRDPAEVMEEFRAWLMGTWQRPLIFVSDNNGFDWQFINWYFHHFLGANPFGFSSMNLTLPGFYTAALEYFATGEGLTRALFMGHAQDAQDLRAQLEARCTSYLARCCRVQVGLKPPAGFEGLLPKDVASTLTRLESQRLPLCNLMFALTFHFNVS